MLNLLRIQRDTVALEAFLISDIQGLLKNVFPTIQGEFNSFVNNFAPDAPGIALTSKQNEFVREISKHSYLDIAPLSAFVPEGLCITYAEYMPHIDAATDHCASIMNKVLSPYSIYLSQLVSNSEQKLATSSNDSFYRELEKSRGAINAKLGSCFKHGSTKTDLTIGDVVSRNSEWPYIFKMSNDITGEMNSVNRKDLNKKIIECSHLLDIVKNKIARNELEGMSPQAIKNIADGAFQVASELEMYSAVFYKTASLVESINRTVSHFETVFKK